MHEHGQSDTHDHHDNDEHDGHAHGGLLGPLRALAGHSHDAHDKVDDAFEANERGVWALKWSMLGLGVTALLQVVIVLASGSAALLADTIHNFGDAATSGPLWLSFALQRRGRTRNFTYGYGRTEDVAGVIIVVLILASACLAGYESLRKLLDPEPVRHLWWVAVAALTGFAGNEAVALFRMRVGRQIDSAALVADGKHSLVDGFTSLGVLIGVLGVALGVPALDPIVGLVITATILFIVKDAATSVFRRLLDGIEPDILEQVEHAPLHVDGVREVHEVRARWMGHRLHADLHITVDPHLSVSEAHHIAERVYGSLKEHVPSFADATIHICPLEATAADD
jgi:cation diffusion facilitator family transporter